MPPVRPISPPPSRPRASNPSKPVHSIHLGNLPRFHPAVYQPPTGNQPQQSPSPLQPRPSQQYRIQSGPRDALRQYRELVTGTVLASRSASSTSSTKPSKPRLDPLNSPGPVTPLALEEGEGGYLAAGEAGSPEGSALENRTAAPTPELVERLIRRESERKAEQNTLRKECKGW
jgi:hypothetical protein